MTFIVYGKGYEHNPEWDETKKEELTVWSGFTSEQMEALNGGNKTELIAHKEEESE